MKEKLILSTIVAGLLVGCGGSSSSTTQDTNTTAKKDTNNTINSTTTRASDGRGAGSASGIGTLTAYNGTYNPIAGEGKKLFALYLLGSDLERKDKSGTNDLNEIVAGYSTLSDDQKAKIDIIVAFGGANKDNWKGMKIANINQIIEDSKDGVYGNSDNYTYVANEANMGYKDSLKLFLTYVKNNYNNHSEKFLDLWDHGAGSVFLLGGDDNYGGNQGMDALKSTITNNDLDSVFKEINMKFNLIGFDTCLNGSMEVARSIAPYSSYLVGSEETEPGHGWNYTHLISNYAKATDFETLGKQLVDSFVDTKSHYVMENGVKYVFSEQSSSGKTLSLVKLSKYNELLEAVNKLADSLAKVNEDSTVKTALIPSISKARGYNVDKEDKTKKVQVDLRHFAALLKNNLAQSGQSDHTLYTLADNVIKAVDSYVIYSKDDGTRSNSSGVTLFSPNDNGAMFSWLTAVEGSKFSTNWYNAVKAYQNIGKTDTQKPTVVAEQATTTVATNDVEKKNRADCAEWYDFESDQEKAKEYEASCLAEYGLKPLSNAKLRSNGTSMFKGEESAFISKASKSKLRNNNGDMKVTTATFSDENLKKVATVYGNMVDGKFLTTAILQAQPLGDKNGTAQTYFTPIWNQKWYTIMPSDDANMSEWIPLVFKERRSNGNVVYEAEIDYVDANGDYSNYAEGEKFDYARLEIVVDENNQLVSNIVTPYTIIATDDGTETIRLGKSKGSLKIGDKVVFYSQNYDITTGETYFNQENDEFTLKQEFNLQVEELLFADDNGNPLDYYYMMVAEDVNGNSAFSALQEPKKDSN